MEVSIAYKTCNYTAKLSPIVALAYYQPLVALEITTISHSAGFALEGHLEMIFHKGETAYSQFLYRVFSSQYHVYHFVGDDMGTQLRARDSIGAPVEKSSIPC